MLSRILFKIFVGIIAWVPIVIWVTSGLWTRDVLGGEFPYPGDGRLISTVITFSLVGLIIGVHLLSFLVSVSISASKKREKQRILREGLPATAKVVSIGKNSDGANIKINGQPYLGLTLEIDDGSRELYIVNLDTIIPIEAIPQYQPGATIDVVVDCDDPKKVVIVT